jgi:2',3'-cyclic-nucleotide 2'-phosphodiesterase (5'-nucleotidase family)
MLRERLRRQVLRLVLLALAVPVTGCGAVEPTLTSTPRPTATSKPTSTPTPQPLSLTVLHTNDVWGETEPCG